MNLVGSSWVRISTMPPLASVTSLSLIKAPPRTQCPQTQDPKYRMTGGFFFDSFHLALVPFPLDSPLLLCPQLFTFVSVVYVCAWFMWLYHAIPHFIPLRQDLSLNLELTVLLGYLPVNLGDPAAVCTAGSSATQITSVSQSFTITGNLSQDMQTMTCVYQFKRQKKIGRSKTPTD